MARQPMSWPRRTGLALLMVGAFQPVGASALNSLALVASALSPSCIEYRIAGICYWLFCTPVGCTVRTSVKVKHYLPDAVVSAYNQTGNNPWSEVAPLGTGISGLAEGGGNNEVKQSGQRKVNLRFKNADAIGHPALAATAFNQMMGSMGYTCSGAATALMPYFLSTLDALVWRSGLPESLYPEALVMGQRELGTATDLWGNVYPRSGWVTQVHDYKAGALVAQRTADIITRSGQLHVYQPMVANRSDGYWPAGEVTENTGTANHKWQQLTPSLSSTCAVFPDGGEAASVAEDGNYAWTLWRPYSCCQRRGQTFLYSTDF
ncbi:TIGR03756 family integrating conjugative element protein [Serratia fonticola]|uniref:TIGR03756 family integrating conjugative element protein n=1 Tax=Serratia fonticola TaxID=47917 RepID=UPI003B2261CC